MSIKSKYGTPNLSNLSKISHENELGVGLNPAAPVVYFKISVVEYFI